ncbi:glycerate kinase, partial [Bordetella pertussis]
ATLVFTGEGRIDAQTLRGKTPAGVARIASAA